LILAPLAVGGIFLLDNQFFALAFGAVFLIGAWEWVRLMGWQQTSVRIAYVVFLALLMFLSWWLVIPNYLHALLWLAVAWWLVALLLVAIYPRKHELWFHPVRGLVAGLLVFIPSWTALVVLQGNESHGPFWVLLMMFLIWGADTGAYFTGKAIGKHKLAPLASPGKTWEGAIGGVVVSILVSWGIIRLFDLHIDVNIAYMFLALMTIIASVVGDLLESIFKRQAGVKDSGRIFPGHGGVLDRLDSLFSASPVFVLGIQMGLV
jgi:phosphatidate cytidylyltransferase